ncbi:hypothetical protein HG535_0B04760 [Zygotorulaspora mrakii]|uniref:RING-type domain-containing protein n=1 Tax=Zygotorulaspora mrakii TaxID=42260 RepID=A0A7H9AZ63_ZYGMR|nr:uncharacterized protein HG535_0B04760 [Zygotorulaspora mrakii]QLG71434.1 hypothetical protein HG535_0B04760 [Zygotorulaspora mrakii]
MSVKTPIQASYEKKVHTPPSIERHDSARPKLVKSFSGKLFRRQLELESNSCHTFDSTGLFVPAYSLSSGKKRTPKPLNLSHPITPPPSLRKTSTTSASTYSSSLNTNLFHSGLSQLESPIKLAPSVEIKNLEILSNSEATYSLNSGISPRHRGHPIVWTETANDPFLEEGSPTYLCDVSENISRVRTNGGHRRFISSTCALCDEKMSSIFCGEKVIEMTCSHACHYECYLTMLESLYFKKTYPCCTICHKLVKPVDEEILEEMISSLLTKRRFSDENYTIEPQNFFSRAHTTSAVGLFTPQDQLIKTSDVSCNGFRTPLYTPPLDRKLTHNRTDSDELDINFPDDWSQTFSGLLDKEQCTNQRSLSNPSLKQLPMDLNGILPSDQCGPLVEICQNSDEDLSSFTIRVKTSGNYTPAMVQLNANEAQLERGETTCLGVQLEEYLKDKINICDQVGSLLIFDAIDYSTDGEQWIANIIAYLFQDILILFDHETMTTVGKIPMKQICQVLKLDRDTLLIDLKSTVLPEVYLSCRSFDSKQSLMEKWMYYMSGGTELPHLEHITLTAWHILPVEIHSAINLHLETLKQNCSFTEKSQPWESEKSNVPLQLIICLSICNYGVNEQKTLADNMKKILNSLNDDDLLGLVIVGRDGRGNIGEYGTFTGTIGKTWDCWLEIFDGLKATSNKVFQSEVRELDKMLETCHHLVTTSDTMLAESHRSRYLKQVLLIRNGEPPNRNSKYYNIIKKHYKFDFLQMPSFSSIGFESSNDSNAKNAVNDLVSTLHDKRIKDLTVTINGLKISLGNFQPGEEKTMTISSSEPDFNQHREYVAEWFDRKIKLNRSFQGALKVLKPGGITGAHFYSYDADSSYSN